MIRRPFGLHMELKPFLSPHTPTPNTEIQLTTFSLLSSSEPIDHYHTFLPLHRSS